MSKASEADKEVWEIMEKLKRAKVIDERDPDGKPGPLSLLKMGVAELKWKGKYVSRRGSPPCWERELVVLVRNKKGRNSIFSGQLVSMLEDMLERGFPLEYALGALAISRDDFEEWIRKDLEGVPRYRGFKMKVENAEKRGRALVFGHLLKKALENPTSKCMELVAEAWGVKGQQNTEPNVELIIESAPPRADLEERMNRLKALKEKLDADKDKKEGSGDTENLPVS